MLTCQARKGLLIVSQAGDPKIADGGPQAASLHPQYSYEAIMTIQEKVYFLRQLQASFSSIGALIPTSRYAARMMTSEFARRAGPRTVLEVGPGTGAITAEIVRAMRPGDKLVLCELNADFVAYLEQRIATEPTFQRVRDQIT